MAGWLLDVNVLVALAWRHHLHYGVSRRWFAANRKHGWATCPVTEMGFVRISMQPLALGIEVSFKNAMETLALNLAAPDHEFWPIDYPFSEILPEIRGRLRGHQQLTDALLLDLAIRKQGRLVTFDKNVQKLLPPDSPHIAAIEVLGI